MKKIIVAAAISMAALVGCTSQSAPAPTVTVTEQIPAPSVDDGAVSSSERFVEFVRQNGGVYGAIANESDIVGIGNTICDGFAGGLTEDEITQILAQSLVNNNMANDDGAQFGAALIVGAKNYLCGSDL
jgi:hypothetical protein